MNNLKKHVKSDKIKWIATSIALLFIALAVVGVCLQVFGSGKVKPSEWFKKDDKQVEQSLDETTNTNTASVLCSASQSDVEISAQSDTVSFDNILDTYPQTVNFPYGSSPAVNNVNSSVMPASSLITQTRKKDDNGYALIINPAVIADLFPSVDSNSYEISGVTLLATTVSYSKDFELCDNGYYFLYIPVQMSFEKKFRVNYTYKETRVPVPLPDDPVKEGYHFVGWYYDEALTQAYDNQPIYSDTQLYAKFEINRYTVTFNSVGGSAVTNMTVDWNTVVSLPDAPTRAGYTFKGWFLPNGTQYTNQPIKSDTALSAQWEVIMCKVTFYVGGEKYEELTVEYGTPLVSIVEQATTLNLQVMSVKANDGTPITSFANATVSSDFDVQAEVMTGADKVKNTLRNNWIPVVVASVSAILFIAIIVVVASKIKKTRRR